MSGKILSGGAKTGGGLVFVAKKAFLLTSVIRNAFYLTSPRPYLHKAHFAEISFRIDF